jgi:hypothetical protein
LDLSILRARGKQRWSCAGPTTAAHSASRCSPATESREASVCVHGARLGRFQPGHPRSPAGHQGELLGAHPQDLVFPLQALLRSLNTRQTRPGQPLSCRWAHVRRWSVNHQLVASVPVFQNGLFCTRQPKINQCCRSAPRRLRARRGPPPTSVVGLCRLFT